MAFIKSMNTPVNLKAILKCSGFRCRRFWCFSVAWKNYLELFFFFLIIFFFVFVVETPTCLGFSFQESGQEVSKDRRTVYLW